MAHSLEEPAVWDLRSFSWGDTVKVSQDTVRVSQDTVRVSSQGRWPCF